MAFNNAYIDAFFTEKLEDKYVRLSAEQTDLGEPLLRLIDAEDAEECSCWAVESDIFQNIWNYCLLTPGALKLVRQKEEEMAMEGEEEIEEDDLEMGEDEEIEEDLEEDLDEYTEAEAQEDKIEMSENKKGKRPMTQLAQPPISASAQQPNPAPAPAGSTPSLSAPSSSSSSLSASSLSASSLPAPAPAPAPITSVTLNALTAPYTGTRPIPADLLNIRRLIRARTSLSRLTRPWIATNLPRTHFVAGGFIADKSRLWNFWMDTRLFEGEMWWYLATRTKKPFPKLRSPNRRASIQPGSIQAALNRKVGWDDRMIYKAPWNPASASAGGSSRRRRSRR